MQKTQLHKKYAMTLIELLVVVAILSVTATLVLESGLDNMVGQAQYDNTTIKAKLVEEAISGTDGRVGRFLEDIGRLPQHVATTGKELSELWENTTGITAWAEHPVTLSASDLHAYVYAVGRASTNPLLFDFSKTGDIAESNGTATLNLYYGWNGPYIAIAGDTFRNGFGEDWFPLDDAYADAAATNPIYGLRTDAIDPVGTYGAGRTFKFTKSLISDARLEVTLKDLKNDPLIAWDGTAWGSVPSDEQIKTFNYTRVFLIAPDSTATSPLISSAKGDSDFTTWTFTESDLLTSMTSFDGTEFAELTPGRYKVFAYAYAIDDGAVVAATHAAYASQVKEIVVYPGFNTLELQLTTSVIP